MGSFWKRWFPDAPQEPTAEEKAASESFLQILKYGEDIGGMWKDICKRQNALYKEKCLIKEQCEKSIIRHQGIVLKGYSHLKHDWNDIYIREYVECEKSPIGCCVTMIEYGSDNPDRDEKQKCFYCNKEH
jgi:hypothetical protein